MACCNVPIVRWREPWIKISRSLGKSTKFNRGTGLYASRLREAFEKFLRVRIKMRAAEQNNGPAFGSWPDANWHRLWCFFQRDAFRAPADDATPGNMKCWSGNNSGDGYTSGDDPDIDCILIAARDEFSCSVKRVH